MSETEVTAANGKKVKIYGDPQNTTGGKYDRHAAAVWEEAMAMARSGDYDYITVNRSWRTATNRMIGSRARPDIIGVRGGIADPVEVPSFRDTDALLRARMNAVRRQHPDMVGPPRILSGR